MSKFTITAKTLHGLEGLLAEEIEAIGGTDIDILTRAVQYTGDRSILYKSNLLLRTALRILRPIHSFNAFSEDELYERVQDVDWMDCLNLNQTFAINATTHGDIFTHSRYISYKVKDAIVDQFREETGERPSIDTKDPDLWIDVHIYDTFCTLSLNSSGHTLAKRGYGVKRTLAPINEALAAGIIHLTGWDKKQDFIDPMCGSGTFAIEAAMIAGNVAPGKRRHFNFEKWKDFDAELWKKIKQEAEDAEVEVTANIYAKDMVFSTLKIAMENAEKARVAADIIFVQEDFFESQAEKNEGVLVMNPPYGERLKQTGIINFYEEIGNQLKQFYEGFDAWVISGHIQALKRIGLRPNRKVPLLNGKLDCRLHKFELYKGSRRWDEKKKEGAEEEE